jgi:hypothetical protein
MRDFEKHRLLKGANIIESSITIILLPMCSLLHMKCRRATYTFGVTVDSTGLIHKAVRVSLRVAVVKCFVNHATTKLDLRPGSGENKLLRHYQISQKEHQVPFQMGSYC